VATRIAMIGAGAVATRHVRVLTGLGARVVGVADPVPAAADRLAAACGGTAYPDADALLDGQAVDAAYVCVPPFAHGVPERAVLARGLPLFVEKPLSADRDTVAALVPLVREVGVVTGTGYHWRCLDTVQAAAELLADSPPRLVTGSWLDKVPPPPWWPYRDQSGGQIVEQLTHVLDLARLFAGEVDAVWGGGSRLPGSPGDADDASALATRFTSGAVGTFAASSLLPAKRRAGLETVSADGLRLEVSETALAIERPGADPQVRSPTVDGHQAVDREFLDAVAGRRETTRVPYEQAWATHRLGLAMAEAVRTGAVVTP
jgi:predicted dehydrogenase